jgi:general secretion pathway protein D
MTESVVCGPLRVGLIVMALTLLASCQPEAPDVLAPLGAPAQLQSAAPRVNSAIQGDRRSQTSFEARGKAVEPVLAPPRGSEAAQQGDVTLNFVDTDIREIARVVLGETLKLNYTIDPSVQGTASLEIGKPVPRAALLSTLETLLNQNGATLVQSDGIYRVMPAGGGTALATVAAPGAVGSGTQIVPLRFASAKELVTVLEPYIAEGGKITADPSRNTLIVSAPAPVRRTLIEMIRAFDIDMLAGQSYALFPVRNGTPDKLAGELEKAFHADGEGPLAGVVRILPMERVNAVLVVSSQPRYIDAAKRLVGLAGRAEDMTARAWHVYYVQNGQSADLENVLQRAFTPGHVAPQSAQPGATAPGAQQVSLGGAPGTGGGGASSLATAGRGTGGLGSATAAANPPIGGPTASGSADTGPAEEVKPGEEAENRIRVIANRRNNALLVYATPNEYAVIEGMLRKIDIIPLQVLIEATIAEVTLNDQLNYGTQFFLGNKVAGTLSAGAAATPASTTAATAATTGVAAAASNVAAAVSGNPAPFLSNFPGFVLNYGVRAAINALAAVTQVKVLSAPQVMVMDNEPARLQVGNQVPVLTGSAVSTLTTGAPIVNSIEYHDTGVIMLVTPRVNSGGLVTLDISQEVSDVASTTTSTIDSPTFSQRLIRTRVAVQDGQTVGMAGLIRDNDQQGNAGIPYLKDIPLLGSLVSSQTNMRQRTELLVLITPRVVHDQRDALALTEDLRNGLINAGLVHQQLDRKPPHGSANPNGL